MSSEAEKQQVLQTSEILMKQEQYELALKMLQPLECIMASYMKGKIYVAIADAIANSFKFKYYCTDAQMTEYREILTCASEHLYQTSCLMPSASHEVQDQLNQTLWYDIGKVDNELCRTRPPVTDDSEDYEDYDAAEDFKMHEKQHIQSVIDEIQYWAL